MQTNKRSYDAVKLHTNNNWYSSTITQEKITALDSSKIITELRDNSLKLKQNMMESQVNDHWILSEI